MAVNIKIVFFIVFVLFTIASFVYFEFVFGTFGRAVKSRRGFDSMKALRKYRKTPSQIQQENREYWSNQTIVEKDIDGKAHSKFGIYTEFFIEGRSYLVFVPNDIRERTLQTPVALTLIFHKSFSTSWLAALHDTKWSRRAVKYEFIVCFMQSAGREVKRRKKGVSEWKISKTVNATSIEDDVAYTSAVLDALFLDKNYLIDPKKVFFVGYGNGATFAMRASLTFASTVASTAVIGGGLDVMNSPPIYGAKRLPSYYIVANQKDSYFEMAQDAYDMTIGAGVGQAKLVLLDSKDVTKHNSTLEDEIWSYFESHPFNNNILID